MKSLKQDLERSSTQNGELNELNKKLVNELELLKAQHASEVEKLKSEKQTALLREEREAAAQNAEIQKLKEHATKIKGLLGDVLNEFMSLRKQLEVTKDYNEAIKLSKRIRDAKKVQTNHLVVILEDFGSLGDRISIRWKWSEEVPSTNSQKSYGATATCE